MTIFAPALGLIWKSVENYGLDPRELFEKAGIDPSLRADIAARVTDEQVDNLLWLAKQQSNDESFCFNIVQNIMPSFMGALGLAWLTSASLRKAIERMQRYGRMVSDEQSIYATEHENELHVRFEPGNYPYRDPALRERHRVANFVQLCRMIHGANFCPMFIQFVHEEPCNSEAYQQYFRCELSFGNETAILGMPLSVSDEPLVGFNPQLVQNLDRLIVEYLAQMDRNDIVSRTRSEILNGLPSGTVSLESVSEGLNMSPRTLIRRLNDENESFKNLLATIRRELGEKYILDKNLSLTEISFLLGFSETSSFSRAFKNWTGQTPRQHRTMLL